MIRRGALLLLAVSVVVGAVPGRAAEEDAAVTVITSDTLTFDYTNHFATFDRNVVVTDPALKLTTDKLTVRFDKDGKAEEIVAEGTVVVQQSDKVARAGWARYEVKSGKILLKNSPRVTRGRDVLEGDTITFWRNESKMICEPQARLIIYPEKGGARTQLLGE